MSLSPVLRAAYQVADYRVFQPTAPFTLHAGVYSAALAQVLRSGGYDSAALLTACNPGSRLCNAASNALAMQRLKQALSAQSCPLLPTLALDPAGEWPPEPGWLALGLSQSSARALGCAYGQNAILWTAVDAVPQLLELV